MSSEMADSEWLEDLSDGVLGDDMPMDRQRAVVICANPQAAFECLAHENYSYPPGRDGVAVKSYQVAASYGELKHMFGEPLDGPSKNRRAATEWIVSFINGLPIDDSAPPPETVDTKEVRISDLAEWYPEYSSTEQLRAGRGRILMWRVTAEDRESALRVASMLTRWRTAWSQERAAVGEDCEKQRAAEQAGGLADGSEGTR